MTLTRNLLLIILAVVVLSVGLLYVLAVATLDDTTKTLWALLFGGLDAFALAHI